jgi:hypothetical protein
VSTVALSPAGALAWLASLSIDLRGAAVLDAAGAVLAGDAAVGARAAEAFAAAGAATSAVHRGDLMAVRAGGHAVAVTVGPLALERVVRCDLEAAAGALGPT